MNEEFKQEIIEAGNKLLRATDRLLAPYLELKQAVMDYNKAIIKYANSLEEVKKDE